MPPENLRYAERLATLEAQHKAMETNHAVIVANLSKRFEEYVEETERRFVMVQSTSTNIETSVRELAKTVNEFVAEHGTKNNSIREWIGVLTPWAFAVIGLVYFYISSGGKH